MKRSDKVIAYLAILSFGIIVFVFGYVISQIIINTVFTKEQIHTEDYTVSSNETLWDIALENKKDGTDTREYVYNLRKLNNIDDCIIHEGQVIKIIK